MTVKDWRQGFDNVADAIAALGGTNPPTTSGPTVGTVTDFSCPLQAKNAGSVPTQWRIFGIVNLLADAGPAKAKGRVNNTTVDITTFAIFPGTTFVANDEIDLIDGDNAEDVAAYIIGTLTFYPGIGTLVDIACGARTPTDDPLGTRSVSFWNDSADPTTWDIHCTVANKIDAGSQFWAIKL